MANYISSGHNWIAFGNTTVKHIVCVVNADNINRKKQFHSNNNSSNKDGGCVITRKLHTIRTLDCKPASRFWMYWIPNLRFHSRCMAHVWQSTGSGALIVYDRYNQQYIRNNRVIWEYQPTITKYHGILHVCFSFNVATVSTSRGYLCRDSTLFNTQWIVQSIVASAFLEGGARNQIKIFI